MNTDPTSRSAPDDPQRLDLDALKPNRDWLDRLPALARESAPRREQDSWWSTGVARMGRWFVPLAAAAAAVCWLASASSTPMSPTRSALLLTGSDTEALVLFPLEARP